MKVMLDKINFVLGRLKRSQIVEAEKDWFEPDDMKVKWEPIPHSTKTGGAAVVIERMFRSSDKQDSSLSCFVPEDVPERCFTEENLLIGHDIAKNV